MQCQWTRWKGKTKANGKKGKGKTWKRKADVSGALSGDGFTMLVSSGRRRENRGRQSTGRTTNKDGKTKKRKDGKQRERKGSAGTKRKKVRSERRTTGK